MLYKSEVSAATRCLFVCKMSCDIDNKNRDIYTNRFKKTRKITMHTLWTHTICGKSMRSPVAHRSTNSMCSLIARGLNRVGWAAIFMHHGTITDI